MFKPKKLDAEDRLMNVKEFVTSLSTHEVGDIVTVVNGSTRKIVCMVQFLEAPTSVDLIQKVAYTK